MHRWTIAQKGEMECWTDIRDKLNSAKYIQEKKKFWSAIIREIDNFKISSGSSVLDVGCGPAGVFLAIDQGNRVGLDPLNSYYIKIFPFMQQIGAVWIDGSIEEYQTNQQFDYIFLLNSLDHCMDPVKVLEKVHNYLKPTGTVILSINLHQTRFWKWYFKLFNSFIDKYHPYQWDLNELKHLLLNFEILKVKNIDNVIINFNLEMNDTQPTPKVKLSSMVLLRNPFKLPVIISEKILGRGLYKKEFSDLSIFSHYLITATLRQ
jgi:2-polyprenyl-6-hydroxyphenyl methylase/3-demethylubiquinone-9 3-methyltransferase